jgi:hypothetical protein
VTQPKTSETGSAGAQGRPKNREVEDEMIGRPAGEGKRPKPATEPVRGGTKSTGAR